MLSPNCIPIARNMHCLCDAGYRKRGNKSKYQKSYKFVTVIIFHPLKFWFRFIRSKISHIFRNTNNNAVTICNVKYRNIVFYINLLINRLFGVWVVGVEEGVEIEVGFYFFENGSHHIVDFSV